MFITWIDVVVITITLFSGLLSLMRGFTREILSLITWLCSAAISILTYSSLAIFLKKFIKSSAISNILSLTIIFIIVFVLLSYFSVKISQILARSFVGPLDKFLGIIYGVTRGVLITAMLVFLTTNIIEAENKKIWLTNAKTYPLLNNIGSHIYSLIPANFLDLDKIFSTIKQKDEQNT